MTSNSDARWESLPTPISTPLSVDDEDALGRPDVEDDPSARPAPPGPLKSARTRRSGSPRGSRAAGPRTASGRWCSGACRTCPASSSSPGPRCRATSAGLVGRLRRSWNRQRAVELEAVGMRDAVHRKPPDAGQLGGRPRVGHERDCRTLGRSGQARPAGGNGPRRPVVLVDADHTPTCWSRAVTRRIDAHWPTVIGQPAGIMPR